MNKRKIIKWILLWIWMLVIFMFSHQPNSGATTYGIIEKILPNIQTNTLISTLNFLIRKSAHLTEYFILAILTVSLTKEYTKKQINIFIISLIFCFSYAVTDEFHQLFVPGRTGALRDVCIDTVGSILFLVLYIIYHKYKKTILSKN